MIYDFAIVGAGISGLDIGWKLDTSNASVLILEKSKSCGGRMATRRLNESKFDHGAQFIKRTKISDALIEFWTSRNILKRFPVPDFDSYFGLGGMTRLTKEISQNLNVKYNSKVITLKNTPHGWRLTLDNGDSILSKNIILSCPLPQSLELLKNSDIPFDPKLQDIHYAKSIVSLISLQQPLKEHLTFVENFDSDIYSICSQKGKGLSIDHNYTIVMTEKWSEDHFGLSDDEIKQTSIVLFKTKFGSTDISDFQIKKWRYCQPTSMWSELFYQPHPDIYLIGDAFGGPSLNGALLSSDGLAKKLISNTHV